MVSPRYAKIGDGTLKKWVVIHKIKELHDSPVGALVLGGVQPLQDVAAKERLKND